MRSNTRYAQADNRFYPPNSTNPQAQNPQFLKNRSSSSSNVTNNANFRTFLRNKIFETFFYFTLVLFSKIFIRQTSASTSGLGKSMQLPVRQNDPFPLNHPFNRVPIAGIEHHLNNINQNHSLLATRLTEYSQNILQTIDHSKQANSKFKVYSAEVIKLENFYFCR